MSNQVRLSGFSRCASKLWNNYEKGYCSTYFILVFSVIPVFIHALHFDSMIMIHVQACHKKILSSLSYRNAES